MLFGTPNAADESHVVLEYEPMATMLNSPPLSLPCKRCGRFIRFWIRPLASHTALLNALSVAAFSCTRSTARRDIDADERPYRLLLPPKPAGSEQQDA
jgi:hypothetical protein